MSQALELEDVDVCGGLEDGALLAAAVVGGLAHAEAGPAVQLHQRGVGGRVGRVGAELDWITVKIILNVITYSA